MYERSSFARVKNWFVSSQIANTQNKRCRVFPGTTCTDCGFLLVVEFVLLPLTHSQEFPSSVELDVLQMLVNTMTIPANASMLPASEFYIAAIGKEHYADRWGLRSSTRSLLSYHESYHHHQKTSSTDSAK